MGEVLMAAHIDPPSFAAGGEGTVQQPAFVGASTAAAASTAAVGGAAAASTAAGVAGGAAPASAMADSDADSDDGDGFDFAGLAAASRLAGQPMEGTAAPAGDATETKKEARGLCRVQKTEKKATP